MEAWYLVQSLAYNFVPVAVNLPAKPAFALLLVALSLGADRLLPRQEALWLAVLVSFVGGVVYSMAAFVFADLAPVGAAFLMLFAPVLAFPVALGTLIIVRRGRVRPLPA